MRILIKHSLPNTSRAFNRLNYTIDFLNRHPLKPKNVQLGTKLDSFDHSIGYGIVDADFQIPFDGIFFQENNIQTDQYFANTYSYKDRCLWDIALSSKRSTSPLCVDKIFQLDIFNTIFFHISRYEEFFAKETDNSDAGWLKESKHFFVRHRIHKHPIVDDLVVAFFEILINSRISHLTTYSISHDVDFIGRFTPYYKFGLSFGAGLLRRTPVSTLYQNSTYFLKMLRGKVKDPYDYFSTMLRKENIWTNKVIYFMTGGETKVDNAYNINDRRILPIIKMAIDRQYKIGLHPSYNAGFKENLFKKEMDLLNQTLSTEICYNRQHFLRFSWQNTPNILRKNGIKIDSSIGYTRRLGFRCGTGFSYQMYNFETEKAFDWIEQPLALMDSAAIHATIQQSDSLAEYLSDFIKNNKHNTHIELNFHNSNFDILTKTGRDLDTFYSTQLFSILK